MCVCVSVLMCVCVCVCVCAGAGVCVCVKYKNRHKCLAERRKPISEQSGSRLCNACGRWFLSAGGLASHKCLSNSAAEVA